MLTDNKISTAKFEVTLLEDGIVENFIKPGAIMEVEDLKIIKQYNFELSGKKMYCVLVTAGELASFSTEAREMAASKEFIEAAQAKALLIDSVAHKIIGNFYLRVNKPFIKTKIFSDRAKALSWLRGFLK